MDILYLLLPMSVLLAFGVIVVFAWALEAGQFDDIEAEGERILDAETPRDGHAGNALLDAAQDGPRSAREQSAPSLPVPTR